MLARAVNPHRDRRVPAGLAVDSPPAPPNAHGRLAAAVFSIGLGGFEPPTS